MKTCSVYCWNQKELLEVVIRPENLKTSVGPYLQN